MGFLHPLAELGSLHRNRDTSQLTLLNSEQHGEADVVQPRFAPREEIQLALRVIHFHDHGPTAMNQKLQDPQEF